MPSPVQRVPQKEDVAVAIAAARESLALQRAWLSLLPMQRGKQV
ncbi:MAG: hypothetical protein V3S30_09810 [Thermoanaerobaculia bacterium]